MLQNQNYIGPISDIIRANEPEEHECFMVWHEEMSRSNFFVLDFKQEIEISNKSLNIVGMT